MQLAKSRARCQVVSVRAAADNQLLKKPEPRKSGEPEPARKLFSDAQDAEPSAQRAAAVSSTSQFVTVEFQRQRAKEMRAYFLEQKAQEVIIKSQVFGFTAKNEINNGRWVMFGLMVGMLTEYATGVDFIHQLGLLGSYLGIVDLD